MHKVELALAALPEDQTSVTYPDSFVAMEVGSISVRRPYHGKVFLLAELPALVETRGPVAAGNVHRGSTWVDDSVQQCRSDESHVASKR
jgi:hypothetical protein